MSGWIQLTYLAATALFILSLKWMNSPETARRGVLSGVTAMLLAVIGTLADTAHAQTSVSIYGLVDLAVTYNSKVATSAAGTS